MKSVAIAAVPTSLLLLATTLMIGCGGRHTWTVTPVSPIHPSDPTNVPPAQPPMAAFIEDVGGQRYIYTATNDGSGLSQISAQPRDFNSVYVLPDGSKGVFSARVSDGYSQLFYLAPFDSSGTPIQLTNTPGHKTGAMLSADGSQITFLYQRSDQVNPEAYVFDIAVMNADGSNLRLVPLPSGFDYTHPFFSPDGSMITGAMIKDGCWDGCSIFLVNADGTNLKTITPGGVDGILAVAPAFSQDGKQIAFSSVGWGDLSTYIMNFDGTDIKHLGAVDSQWGDPLFAGDRIVFVTSGEIYSVKPDGSDMKRVTNNGYADSFEMPIS